MDHSLTFLGTGAAGGVPSFFCTCAACTEAANEPRSRRTRCGILINGNRNVLVDAPPDLREQLTAARVQRIDDLVLSHGHYDHCGGLPELEFYVRVQGIEPVPSYMSSETAANVDAVFGFMTDCLDLRTIEAGRQFAIDGIAYTPLEVTHAAGTFGLLIETERGRTAYITDTGPLPRSTMERIRGVSTLILGSTFWGENPMPEDHLSVEEAVAIAKEIRPENFYLTHLAMHYSPVTNRELESYLAPLGASFRAAYDGLSITI